MKPVRLKARPLYLGATKGNDLAKVITSINILAHGRDVPIEAVAKDVRMKVRKVRLLINRQACNVRTAPGVRLLRTFQYSGGGGNGKLVSVRLANTKDDAPLVARALVREAHLADNHDQRGAAIRRANASLVGKKALQRAVDEVGGRLERTA